MGGCLSYRLKLIRDLNPNEDTLLGNVTSFSYKSLKKATNNFSNRLRSNGFPSSYKGTLTDGLQVIVNVYRTDYSVIDLASIIKIMSGVRHQNVVELIGYCIEGNHKMLVHEFVGDCSLDQLLFPDSSSGVGDRSVLDWPMRVSICFKIVRVLEYLHCGISPRVVLRDFKPGNVLMDSSFNPKIVGFECSSLLEDSELDRSSRICGTIGYLDIEYCITGRYSEKTDVFSFGITLLEIISGKKNLRFILVNWAWDLQASGRIPEIVDPTLSQVSEDEVIRFVKVALSCVQYSELRPSMSEVRVMLSDGYDFSNMVLTRP